MESTVYCPGCRRDLVITPRLTGALVKCSCGARFHAGEDSPPTLPPARDSDRRALLVYAVSIVLGVGALTVVVFLDQAGFLRLPRLVRVQPQPHKDDIVAPAPRVRKGEPNEEKSKKDDVPLPAIPVMLVHAKLDVVTSEAVLARQAEEKQWLAALRKKWADYGPGPLDVFVNADERALALAFAPTEPLLAVATQKGVRLWDMQTGKAVRTLAAQVGHTPLLRFAPDGAFVVITGDDHRRRLTILPTDDGAARNIITDRPIQDLAFTADGKRLVALLHDPIEDSGIDVRVWEVGGWKEVKLNAVPVEPGLIGGLFQLSPEGSCLAFQNAFGKATVRNVEFGKMKRLAFPRDESAGRFAFSPDARQLVVTSDGDAKDTALARTFVRVDLETGAAEPFFATRDSVSEIQLTPDGRFVLLDYLPKAWTAGNRVRMHKLIEVATGRERWSRQGDQRRFALSPGAVLAACTYSQSGNVALYDLEGLTDERWADLAPTFTKVREAGHHIELVAGKIKVVSADRAKVEELDVLIKTLPTIDSISIHRSVADSNAELLVPLSRLDKLEELELDAWAFDVYALKWLHGLKNLRWLRLIGNVTDAELVHLEALTNLRRLDLAQARVSDDAVSRLRKALPGTTVIGFADNK